MHERRSYERFEVDGKVTLKDESGQSIISEASLNDFSFKGFGFYCQDAFKKDVVISFDIFVQPFSETLSGKGRIRHTANPIGFASKVFNSGVEFIDVNSDHVTHILKRIQAKIINELRNNRQSEPLNFLPY